MAKKYIPGVSGLLTEPNPVDSPANTLSEAENVIVDQYGKVQSRHGLNISFNDADRRIAQYSSKHTNISSIKKLNEPGFIVGNISFENTYVDLRSQYGTKKFIISKDLSKDFKPLTSTTYSTTKSSELTLNEFIAHINDVCDCNLDTFYFTTQGYYVKLVSYIDLVILPSEIASLVGFTPGQHIFASAKDINLKSNSALLLVSPDIDQKIEYQAAISSFDENSVDRIKVFELKNNKNQIYSGYIVKQNINEYTYKQNYNTDTGVATYSFLVKNPSKLYNYRIYQIDNSSSKVLAYDTLPFTNITNSFYNNETFYIETENGIAESNINDLFQPTKNRFFTVSWPYFPDLNISFRKDDIFQNWFLSGYKCGIRYTFYRETGYNNEQGYVYESQPSRVYEVYNDNEDSVLDIQFSFNTILESNDLYDELNKFCTSNNGRKFGIKVYRTPLVKILTDDGKSNSVGAEYYQCSDVIPFESIMSTKLKFEREILNPDLDEVVHEYTIEPYGSSSVYNRIDTTGQLKINDVLSYYPNKTEYNLIYSTQWEELGGRTPPLRNGYIYEQRHVQYDEPVTNPNDLLPAKLKVISKSFLRNSDLTYDNEDNNNTGTFTNTSGSIIPGSTLNRQYIGITHFNQSNTTRYINCVKITKGNLYDFISQNQTSAKYDYIGIDIYQWDFDKNGKALQVNSEVMLGTKLSSSSVRIDNINYITSVANENLYDNYYLSTDKSVHMTLDRLVEFRPGQGIVIAFWYKSYSLTGTHTITEIKLQTSETDSGYTHLAYPVKLQDHYTMSWIENENIYVKDSYISTPRLDIFTGKYYKGKFAGILGRRDKKYSYVFQAESYITDDSDKNYPQHIMNPGDYLRNDIFTTPVEVTYTSSKYFKSIDQDISLSAGTKIRFTNILENTTGGTSDIQEDRDYYLAYNSNLNAFQVSENLTDNLYNNTPTKTFTVTPSSSNLAIASFIQTDLDSFTNYRAFVKDFKIPILLNDDTLKVVGEQLYTNPFMDGASHTNILAPAAVFSKSFKDFQVYAGIKEPLTAKIAVIKQPFVQNCELGTHMNYTYFSGGSTYDYSSNIYPLHNLNIDKLPYSNFDTNYNPPLYIESSILGPKIHAVESYSENYTGVKANITQNVTTATNSEVFTINSSSYQMSVGDTIRTGDALTGTSGIKSYTTHIITSIIQQSANVTKLTLREENSTSNVTALAAVNISSCFYTSMPYDDTSTITLSNNTNSVPPLTIFTLTGNTYTYKDFRKYRFGATVFERPWLSLKLTSLSNDVNYVNIKLTPLYNRNGYYPLSDKLGNSDKKYLDANQTVDQLNYAKVTDDVSVLRVGFNPGMVEGTNSGQCEADGQYIGAYIDINVDTSPFYLNKDTLTINNINRFDKERFKEPGFLLIQMIYNDIIKAYSLISYSNIVTEQNSINKYTFKNLSVKYLSVNGVTETSNLATTLSYLKADTINMWFIEGSTIEGMPLYAYKESVTTRLNITHTSSKIVEYQNDSYDSTPLVLNNSKFPDIPGLVFKPHRNIDSPIVAYLNSDGSLTFVGAAMLDETSYLDQYAWTIVELFNKELQTKGINAYLRKANETGYIEIVYPDGAQIELRNGTGSFGTDGKHQFSPPISSEDYTILATSDSSNRYSKNEIQWSRRGIPEIVTLESWKKLGADNKEFIGSAQNIDDLYLFKEDGIFRVSDKGTIQKDIPYLEGGFTHFSTTSICVSGNSIQEIENEIIYLDQNGFMSIVDGGIRNISGAIQRDILTLISITPKIRIRSFVNKSKGLYYCTLINETDENLKTKSGTYIFNTRTRQWTFMDEEILDGVEDSNNNNLVIYRQKNPLVKKYDTFLHKNSQGSYTYNGKQEVEYYSFEFDYPIQKSNTYNNFYHVARESKTSNIKDNSIDQYDFRTGEIPNYYNNSKNTYITLFSVNSSKSQFAVNIDLQYAVLNDIQGYGQTNHIDFVTYNSLKYNNFYAVPYGVELENQQYSLTDSITQFFINRNVYIKLNYGVYDGSGNFNPDNLVDSYQEIHQVKLLNLITNGQLVYTLYYLYVRYIFEFVDKVPDYFYDKSSDNKIRLDSYEFLTGVPAKITFNPESGTSPDTNKLFQEFMIHTETANKGATMAFKTDSRSNFSSDRRFVYDANATNRNVFRTYIPTSMSRGRYLIRQVKHDLPLENLIITGQTIVMRDSGSTRVQKDGDNE